MSISRVLPGLLLVLLGLPLVLTAQPGPRLRLQPGPPGPPPAENYLTEKFTTDNGLPSNGIKGLQWDDSTGFLWIATEAGVTRYNGADFVTFDRENTPGLVSERMLFLLKNHDGRIYSSDEHGDIFA